MRLVGKSVPATGQSACGPLRSGAGLLALFILLRGSDSTVLKLLQQAGAATHANGGPEAISFCNVFFFSSLVTGLVLVLSDHKAVQHQLPLLSQSDRWVLALQSFSGFFLGPMAFYLALDRLTVVQQTLLFSLTVPATALMAAWLLREPLPRTFPLSCVLISAGLLIANHPKLADPMLGQLDARGLLWAMAGVAAFAFSSVVNRIAGRRGMPVGLTVGINSLAASLAFAIIAFLLFGPTHFFYLSAWWVLGVIGGYAVLISLGSQWSLMQCYTMLPVVQVSLWASFTLIVSLVEARLWLAEPLHPQALVGSAFILAALGLHHASQLRSHVPDEPQKQP